MNGNVLLVDDEAPITEVLTRTLKGHGYMVTAVASGMAALYSLTETVPDVMLLDINLPDITGWEVLRRLAPADRERVPVIVFSASPLSPTRVAEFVPAGVLIKPFPVDALLRLVGELVAGKQGDAARSPEGL